MTQVLVVGDADGDGRGDLLVPRNRQMELWSEAAGARATPLAEVSDDEVYSHRSVTVGRDGRAEAVTFKNCPEYLRDSVREAVMDAAWYPLRPPQRARFDFRFVFKEK